MKFDVVIGNPPYQENDGGKRADGSISASASPIYPAFVKGASQVGNIQSLIIPARWTTGAGKGLTQFSRDMLSSKNIRRFNYYTDAQDVFSNNLIRGGVCFYIMDNDYEGKATVSVISKSNSEASLRYLDEHSAGVFIPFSNLSNILTKVNKVDDVSNSNMQDIVSSRNPYGLSTDFLNNPSKYNLDSVNKEKTTDKDIEIHGLYKRKRVSRFIPNNYTIPRGGEYFECYKVFLPYASGGNMIGMGDEVQLLGTPVLGKPGEICTETYLNIGCFSSAHEAENLYKYIKSKFLRTMVGILKSTQHATTTFRLVPLQDFTSDSDIDWTQSIADIDQQLYKKYGLNEEEIEFIETNVKEME